MSWIGLPRLQVLGLLVCLLVERSDHTTGSKNIKLGVVFKVQKMALRCIILPQNGPVLFTLEWTHRATFASTSKREISVNYSRHE